MLFGGLWERESGGKLRHSKRFALSEPLRSLLAAKALRVGCECVMLRPMKTSTQTPATCHCDRSPYATRTASNARRRRLLGAIGAALVAVAPTAWGGDGGLIAPGAKVEKLAGDCLFTEGPAADAAGNVFFTDQPNDRILKWSLEGKLSTFLQPCGRANGLCFDKQGNLLACADETNQLWSVDPAGKATVLVKDYQGKLLNGPNDLWVHPDGRIYFTDPFYKRSYWKRGPMEQDGQHVYCFWRREAKLVRVINDLKQPNGIIGTPEGKTLYVADIGAGRTYAYEVQPDGALANQRLFCNKGSDGMTIDAQGNVYLTGRGVTVFDAAGKQIEQIDVDEPWTANVCFGGKDMQTLFITASKSLYAIRLRVKGVGSQ